jgi:hypothetical protein
MMKRKGEICYTARSFHASRRKGEKLDMKGERKDKDGGRELHG